MRSGFYAVVALLSLVGWVFVFRGLGRCDLVVSPHGDHKPVYVAVTHEGPDAKAFDSKGGALSFTDERSGEWVIFEVRWQGGAHGRTGGATAGRQGPD